MNDEKKQVPLRLSKHLYDKLSQWADEEFRSVNGQIEYLLSVCVEKKYHSDKKAEKDNKQKDVSNKLR